MASGAQPYMAQGLSGGRLVDGEGGGGVWGGLQAAQGNESGGGREEVGERSHDHGDAETQLGDSPRCSDVRTVPPEGKYSVGQTSRCVFDGGKGVVVGRFHDPGQDYRACERDQREQEERCAAFTGKSADGIGGASEFRGGFCVLAVVGLADPCCSVDCLR